MKPFYCLGVLTSLFLLISVTAHSTDEKTLSPIFENTFVHLKTNCKVGEMEFEILLANDLKEEDEEYRDFGYPYVWVRIGKRAPFLGLEAREYNELLFLETSKGNRNGGKKAEGCEKTFAYQMKDGTIAVLLRQNDRPMPDQVAVFYFDPGAGKTVAGNRELGAFKEVTKTDDGFEVEVAMGPTDLAINTVQLNGQLYGAEELTLSYWVKVQSANGSVKASLDPDLTWKKSQWANYFKSREEFDRAFGLDLKKGTYANQWIYLIRTTPWCIQPLPYRTIKGSDTAWHCKGK